MLTFPELAEGEQQLLTVLGLLRFPCEEESVFLLDEPDTHLNPAWSLKYLELLEDVVAGSNDSHVIIATHDPLTIGGLNKEQVQVLYRDDDTGRIYAQQPHEDPKGMGVAALLTSELFGLRSTVDPQTLRELDRKRELASKQSLTKRERAELDRLNESLVNLDFTRSVRDPLYKLFVDAMMASNEYRPLRKPVLSPGEEEEQRRLAEKILQDLKVDDNE